MTPNTSQTTLRCECVLFAVRVRPSLACPGAVPTLRVACLCTCTWPAAAAATNLHPNIQLSYPVVPACYHNLAMCRSYEWKVTPCANVSFLG
jgi:hypothetical protein